MFEQFREILENRHQYAEGWKARTEGKVIGYLCTYVPEEIIYAAGILPVRIMGGHEPPYLADSYISGQFCVLCRDYLAEGLKGRYNYLDGVAHAHSCLHMRQTFNSWEMHLPISYSHFISMPKEVRRPYARGLLIDELRLFQHSLAEWTGKEISPDALDRAIEVYNTNRRLMRQIYELRKKDPPLLSGLEAMEMVLSSMVMDKEEHNHLLRAVLAGLPERKDGPGPGVRLLVFGGENDDLEFMEMVESLGANVVIDESCAGSRYFWNEVIPEEDRLSAIASRYLERPVCPAKDSSDRIRSAHILKLAKDYDVRGAIVTIMKWCEPHGFDNVALMGLLEANNIPTYLFEFDVVAPVGQFRTRVEAFLEQIRAEALF